MNKIITLAMILVMVVGCKKSSSNVNMNPIVINPMDTSINGTQTDTTLFLSGRLIPNPSESANGVVKIYKSGNNYTLALDSFIATQGPDLHVYLAQEAVPVHIIDLGNLKSVTGYQTYKINGTPDFAKFKFATIHCQQYNVVFGYASLK